MDKDKTDFSVIEAREPDKKVPPIKGIDDVSCVIQRAAIRTRIQQQAEAPKERSLWGRVKAWVMGR